jgi:hypothetical protein
VSNSAADQVLSSISGDPSIGLSLLKGVLKSAMRECEKRHLKGGAVVIVVVPAGSPWYGGMPA